MKTQKYKTTAMIADDLKAHHLKLFYTNIAGCCLIAAFLFIVALVATH